MTRDRSPESGFVLIGVIMFVLALTILGLSLFSLSGYEVAFLGSSLDDTRAFYDALGGIDRAKFCMAESQLQTLADVKNGLPIEGVVYARARYVGTDDSTSAVLWDGTKKVEIRVVAVENKARRVVEAQFTP